MRRTNLLAAALIAPLLLLILGSFLVPVGLTLFRAVADREVVATLPETSAILAGWDGEGLPPEAAFAALAREAGAALQARRIGDLAQRLNFERTGLRTALLRVARAADRLAAPHAQSLPALDARWGERETWLLLQRAGGPTTALYLLRAMDATRTPQGEVRALPVEERLYRTLFLRTLGISLLVTALCVLLAYPVAAAIAGLRPPWSAVALTLVLIPFWSSVLVRSTAWFVLLQREGPVNGALQALGMLEAPVQMLGTRFAVVLALVHVLLPFAILPMHSVMKGLDGTFLRAAASLGANGPQRFLRVWLPLSLPGVLAGGAMVFLLSVGMYTAPALVGGDRDQMVAWFIANFMNRDVNWGMAAALSAYLLAMTGAMVGLVRVLTGGVAQAGLRG
ncbi:ABC transporter permease [Falsiroseomonas selenitidurans]|uniref:ABC transporter permease n=1 Tax=Falsiroseomonas selenitidurans TaxID=2716335 RepID=A0ABX1E1E7_9PROT|nr:ABC transporter permease [Falsiroseomonas selenitidurans]NKC29633.1 ABC transporter permease [Falsiroseomonas selenitidurans]